MSENKGSIQILRGATSFDPATRDLVLLDGQPFYSKKTKKLYIGDGKSPISKLEGTTIGIDGDEVEHAISQAVQITQEGGRVYVTDAQGNTTTFPWGFGYHGNQIARRNGQGILQARMPEDVDSEVVSEGWSSLGEAYTLVNARGLKNAIEEATSNLGTSVEDLALTSDYLTISVKCNAGQSFSIRDRFNLLDNHFTDWGDGTINSELNHIYEKYGYYTIKVYGVIDLHYAFNQYMFGKDSSITALSFSRSIKSIPSDGICGLTELETLELPEGISVEVGGITNCPKLKYLRVPNNAELQHWAMHNNIGLEELVIGKNVSLYTGDWNDQINGFDPAETFKNCTNLKTVIFEDSPGTSYSNWFNNCPNLEKIIVPHSDVEACKSNWPADIAKLVDGYAYLSDLSGGGSSESYTKDEIDTKFNEDRDRLFILEKPCIEATIKITSSNEEMSIGGLQGTECIDWGDGSNVVTQIGPSESHTYKTPGNYIIRISGASSIGLRAFAGTKITSVVIPDGIESINAEAFLDCYTLKKITIPDSVTYIGNSAFQNCDEITSIVIPQSVTSIGYDAFYGCFSLSIYCETSEQPSTWNDWNTSDRPVIWGYKNKDHAAIVTELQSTIKKSAFDYDPNTGVLTINIF